MSLRLDKIGIWGGIAVACLAGFVGLGLVWQESRSGEKIERLTEQMGAVERSIGAVIDLGKPGIVFLVVSAFISFIVGIVIFRRLGIAHRRALSLKKYVTDVIASVPSGMLILSGDLHILSANPSFRAMMGKPKVDLRKRPLEEISPVADLRNRASEVLAAGTPQDNIVVELPEEDRSLRVAITPIHPSDPEDKARLLLMVEDITELKKAESRTHAILHTAQEGVVVADEGGKIIWVNPAAEHIFGWRAERLIDLPLTSLMAERHRKAYREAIAAVLRSGSLGELGKPLCLEGLRRNGTVFPMEAVISSFRQEGRWVFTAFLRDKTEERMAEKAIERAYGELKEAQAQLVHSEKMASIGQLAAGVAHEINNPVGFLSSNLRRLKEYSNDLFQLLRGYELLLAASEKGDTAVVASEGNRVRAMADQMQAEFIMKDLPVLLGESIEGLDRVRRIVLDLKGFSHVDQAERKASDLNRGLESTLKIVWNELKYKADVIKEFGEIPEILCYPQQLNQVFMNLLVNAAQSIEQGAEPGTVAPPGVSLGVSQRAASSVGKGEAPSGLAGGGGTVAPPMMNKGKVWVRTYLQDGHIVVEVEDTGNGISSEHLNKIFDPFFTTKPVGKGSGLGLSISYGIIKKHGGRIEVESKVGKGTKIQVLLPYQEP